MCISSNLALRITQYRYVGLTLRASNQPMVPKQSLRLHNCIFLKVTIKKTFLSLQVNQRRVADPLVCQLFPLKQYFSSNGTGVLNLSFSKVALALALLLNQSLCTKIFPEDFITYLVIKYFDLLMVIHPDQEHSGFQVPCRENLTLRKLDSLQENCLSKKPYQGTIA